MATEAYDDALLCVPGTEYAILQEKSLDEWDAMGNLLDRDLVRILGGPPSAETVRARDIAEAMIDGDLCRIRVLGVPRLEKHTVEKSSEPIIIALTRKPLHLPNKCKEVAAAKAVQSASKAAPAGKTAKDEKLEATLLKWWDLFIALAAYGAFWSANMQDQDFLAEVKEALLDDWAQNASCVEHLRYVLDWVAWMEQKKGSWTPP